MDIIEQQIFIDSNWFSPEREIKRSQCLHLSHVIDFIEAQEGMDRGSDGRRIAALHNYGVAGFGWERVLRHLIEESPEELFEWLFTGAFNEVPNPKVVRPGEIILDGIAMTPDAYHIDDSVLEEYKYTNKSSKGGIEGNPKFRRWLQYQIPSYLKALGLLICRLRVYFARGDYRNQEPEWREAIITYQQHELDEIWDCILLNAQTMRDLDLVKY